MISLLRQFRRRSAGSEGNPADAVGSDRSSRRPRPSGVRRLLKSLVSDAEELERLTRFVTERRSSALLQVKIFLVASTLLVIINLFTTAFDPTLDPGSRGFSLLTISIFSIFWAPLAFRDLWIRPRTLSAQRLLARQLRLVTEEGHQALIAEIGRLAFDLRMRLAAAGASAESVSYAEQAAHTIGQRLEQIEGPDDSGKWRTEKIQLQARLEALRTALASIETRGLLEADYYDGEAVQQALRAAVALLDGGVR